MRISDSPFLHIVHPNPVQWSSIIRPIALALNVPTVSYSEWLSCLQRFIEDSSAVGAAVGVAAENPAQNPALRLIDFYVEASKRKTTDDQQQEAFVGTSLETKEAVKVSKTMAELLPLSETDVRRWLSYWQRAGVLAQGAS